MSWRLIAFLAGVALVSALLSYEVHACERPHHDGIALWCCPAETGTCELVGFVDDAVSA